MTPDQAVAIISGVTVVGTLFNIYLTLSIRNSVLTLKLWARENFVSKEDLPQYLQFAESKARVIRAGHGS